MSELALGVLLGVGITLTHWLAYRFGRHVESPGFWAGEERARVSETPEEDPR